MLRRKLEHLRIREAKNADALQDFAIKEEIREAQAKIAELSAEVESQASTAVVQNPIVHKLTESMSNGLLIDSRLAPVVKDCCIPVNPQPLADYEFGRLERAILLADQVFVEAAEMIAFGKDATQEVAAAVAYMVVGLAHICKPSNRLKRLLWANCEAIVATDEIDGSIEWTGDNKQELYRAAMVASSPLDEVVVRLLERVLRL